MLKWSWAACLFPGKPHCQISTRNIFLRRFCLVWFGLVQFVCLCYLDLYLFGFWGAGGVFCLFPEKQQTNKYNLLLNIFISKIITIIITFQEAALWAIHTGEWNAFFFPSCHYQWPCPILLCSLIWKFFTGHQPVISFFLEYPTALRKHWYACARPPAPDDASYCRVHVSRRNETSVVSERGRSPHCHGPGWGLVPEDWARWPWSMMGVRGQPELTECCCPPLPARHDFFGGNAHSSPITSILCSSIHHRGCKRGTAARTWSISSTDQSAISMWRDGSN